jgi:hypothetical protein
MGVPSSQVSWSLQTLKAADAQYGVSRDRSTLSEKHQDAAAPSRPVQVFNPATSEAYHSHDHVPDSRPRELSCQYLSNRGGHYAPECCDPTALRRPLVHHAYSTFLCPWGSARIPQKACFSTNPLPWIPRYELALAIRHSRSLA